MKGILKFTSAIDKEVGVSAFLPYSGHVTRNIVKMMNGDMMFTIRLSGAAHQSADISDLNGWHSQLNGFIRNISSPMSRYGVTSSGVKSTNTRKASSLLNSSTT
mgnify:CR=1 FL=1